jgi:hypothetical protein
MPSDAEIEGMVVYRGTAGEEYVWVSGEGWRALLAERVALRAKGEALAQALEENRDSACWCGSESSVKEGHWPWCQRASAALAAWRAP